MMINKLKTFFASESGAVTVDWVVLTAAIVLLAAGATVQIQASATDVNNGTGAYIANRPIGE